MDWIEAERKSWKQLVWGAFFVGFCCGVVIGMMIFAVATAP